jgi:hypothetical protein
MSRLFKSFIVGVGTLALLAFATPGAVAQCGLPAKMVKPSGWSPQFGQAHLQMVADQLGDRSDGDRQGFGPSIVGMWHVIFNALTGPVTGPIDNAVVVWHSDGTEIMNSSRPAQDGNFCLGVWAQTGPHSYFLNHIPWQGNDTSAGPSAIGNAQDGAQLTEQVILSPDGNSYTGSFKLVAYDGSGNAVATFTGTIKATRITPTTPFGALL